MKIKALKVLNNSSDKKYFNKLSALTDLEILYIDINWDNLNDLELPYLKKLFLRINWTYRFKFMTGKLISKNKQIDICRDIYKTVLHKFKIPFGCDVYLEFDIKFYKKRTHTAYIYNDYELLIYENECKKNLMSDFDLINDSYEKEYTWFIHSCMHSEFFENEIDNLIKIQEFNDECSSDL